MLVTNLTISLGTKYAGERVRVHVLRGAMYVLVDVAYRDIALDHLAGNRHFQSNL